MRKDTLKSRLVKTHSRRFLSLSLYGFIPVAFLCLTAMIVIGMCQDYFRKGMFMAWISIPLCGLILMALVLVIVPMIIGPIDKKKHGKGMYTAQFECDFTDEKRYEVTHLLSGLGFMVNEQKDALYFTKSVTIKNGSSCCHITLYNKDGQIAVAVYLSPVGLVASNFIGLYGYSQIQMKNNCRRIVALVLNDLGAPAEIMV
jgi:hypothetical protein